MTLQERFEAKFTRGTEDECWVWTAATIGGYGWFFVHTGVNEYAHRMSYKLYKGAIPEGMCVLHHCDNPSCVNPKHLSLGTQSDNIIDCVRKGRFNKPAGAQHYNARLTVEQVTVIRSLPHVSVRQLAETYGVSLKTIESIRYGYRWKSVNTFADTE